MKPEVSTRTVRLPDDTELLLSVYRSTRENEAALFGWTEDEVSRFMRSQFEAQSSYYAEYFPTAEHSMVLVGDSPAGRLVVDRSENAVHIIDISLLPSVRRRGVGTELVHRLLAEAEGRGVPVTCHVEAGNQARSFWQHLGFIERPAARRLYIFGTTVRDLLGADRRRLRAAGRGRVSLVQHRAGGRRGGRPVGRGTSAARVAGPSAAVRVAFRRAEHTGHAPGRVPLVPFRTRGTGMPDRAGNVRCPGLNLRSRFLLTRPLPGRLPGRRPAARRGKAVPARLIFFLAPH